MPANEIAAQWHAEILSRNIGCSYDKELSFEEQHGDTEEPQVLLRDIRWAEEMKLVLAYLHEY